MAANNEPAKLLLPYLQRADELQQHDPLVAYYCRLYAMERGLKIPKKERTNTTTTLLVSLIKQLEKDRKSMKFSPDDHLHLEGFALNVFAKADKQDRAGRADMNTAKTFYAASIFFEILKQSGEITPDLEQKQKYAAWKAADISKALKEGRKPVPAPPGGETDLSTPSSPSGRTDVEPRHAENDINPSQDPDPTPPPEFPDVLKRQTSTGIRPPPPPFANGDYSSHTADYPNFPHPYRSQSCPQDLHQPPHIPQTYPSREIPTSFSYPNFQSYPSFSESSLPSTPLRDPSYHQGLAEPFSHQVSTSPSSTNYSSAPQYNNNQSIQNGSALNAQTTVQSCHYDSNYQPPPEKIAEAQKAARFAVEGLAFNEVPVAVEHLRKALEFLTNPSADQ